MATNGVLRLRGMVAAYREFVSRTLRNFRLAEEH